MFFSHEPQTKTTTMMISMLLFAFVILVMTMTMMVVMMIIPKWKMWHWQMIFHPPVLDSQLSALGAAHLAKCPKNWFFKSETRHILPNLAHTFKKRCKARNHGWMPSIPQNIIYENWKKRTNDIEIELYFKWYWRKSVILLKASLIITVAAMMTRITTMTAAMTTMTTMTTMAMIVSEPGTLGLFPASCGKTCPGSIYDPHTREILSGQMDKSNDDVHGEILFWQMNRFKAVGRRQFKCVLQRENPIIRREIIEQMNNLRNSSWVPNPLDWMKHTNETILVKSWQVHILENT